MTKESNSERLSPKNGSSRCIILRWVKDAEHLFSVRAVSYCSWALLLVLLEDGVRCKMQRQPSGIRINER
jgi:hypothetical protein